MRNSFLGISLFSYLILELWPVGFPCCSNFSSPVKLSKLAGWVLAGFGFLTTKVICFQPHLLGTNMFPSPGREAGIIWPNTHLSDDMLLRTGFPVAISPLSLSLYPFGRTGLSGGCCAVGCFRSPQNIQTHSAPLGSICWRCSFRRAEDKRGNELDLPLGSRHAWLTSPPGSGSFPGLREIPRLDSCPR